MHSSTWSGPISIPSHSAPVALGCLSTNECAINTANGNSYLLSTNNWSGPHTKVSSLVPLANYSPPPSYSSFAPYIPPTLPNKGGFPTIPNLQGIMYSCIQPTACLAITTAYPFPFPNWAAAYGYISSVYVYSHGTWVKTHQFRSRNGSYDDVSCVVGPFCLAVGGYGDTDSTPWFSVYHG